MKVIGEGGNSEMQNELQIILKAKNNPEFKEKIFNKYENMIFDFINKLNLKNRSFFEDLVQCGFLGLNEAIKKFKPEKQSKFSTYAFYWIKAYILKCLSENINQLGINFPREIQNKINSFNKIQNLLQQGVNKEEFKMTQKDLEQIETFLFSSNKIDENINYLNNEEEVLNKINNDFLKEILLEKIKKLLTKKEFELINMKFGLEGKKYSLKDIAKKYNLTVNRVRNIIEVVLDKIKKQIDLNELKEL